VQVVRGPGAAMFEFLGYLVSPILLSGAVLSLKVSSLALIGGLALGLTLALMRLSRYATLRGISWTYIWFIRGTPLLLQLVFLFDLLPTVGIKMDSVSTAIVGFALNEAAFAAEIIRGSILSVNRNQSVAAAALGLPPLLAMRRIILPQAMRGLLPGIGNQTISLIKSTSIASVIFVSELTFRAEEIVGQNFQFFRVFAAAGLIYLLTTSAVAIVQAILEKHFDYLREPAASNTWPPAFLGMRRRELPPPPPRARRENLPALIRDICGDMAGAGSGPFVVCSNVQKSYGVREILQGIDFTVNRGEVVVLMGPSGSGKSTLLRMVNHLEPLDWGEITVDGKHVGYQPIPGGFKPVRRLAQARAEARIGMVFQQFDLFDHLTALENIVEAPIQVFGQSREQARAIGRRLLSSVGLAEHADHHPHRMSGGQQQRVAIARALALSPRLMLFDEPTSALDPELVGEVLNVIRGLAEAGMTMIIVTHEIRFARDVADRIVFMDGGVIVEQGPPDEVLDRPQHERTRRFLRTVTQMEDERTT
jgi:polar amino acid transport system permease protein